MQHRITAFLPRAILVLSSHFTIGAEATLKDVNRALASTERVVLIGVPAEFLRPETIEDDGSRETQSDWAYYLGNWIKNSAKGKKLKVIIVPLEALAKTLQTPVLKGYCATLFVRSRTEGLLYNGDGDCVLQFDEYDVGAKWLQGTASQREIAQSGSKMTAVVIRTRK